LANKVASRKESFDLPPLRWGTNIRGFLSSCISLKMIYNSTAG
jgi:hypothetical protein